jgi:membrane associated rhomboid family serine protease
MVLPLFDENTGRRTTPYVNYAIIAANVLVFFVLQGMGDDDRFTYAWACVPEEIVTGRDVVTPPQELVNPITGEKLRYPGLQPTPVSVYLTLLTSMFMHGGLAHLLGNMLFLWIFGDNVEDELGHERYSLFYLACGVLASLAHVASTYAFKADPEVPSLGASGAISGVLGAYLILHPNRRVTVLLFRFLTDVPAYVAIGIWFLFQIISSLGALGPGSAKGGVAYGAHIGGFVAGAVLVKLFAAGRTPSGRQPPRGWPRQSL